MKIAIVNRSFWPIYPVIGEALLKLAETLAHDSHNVQVIMQDHVNILQNLKVSSRGKGIAFYPIKALSTSESSILVRILDTLFFMLGVFYSLLKERPNKVYVSTDPPILVPFIVMIYCCMFRAKYIYHVQDIHPEASTVVFKINSVFYNLLRWLDTKTLENAESVITITDTMMDILQKRTNKRLIISSLDNPAISFDNIHFTKSRKKGFTFCGNAGRLQHISLLVLAIKAYCEAGGSLEFVFAGGGLYSRELELLATQFENVQYLGKVSPITAAELNTDYTWSLLPIEDKVTKFAFPSKASSYVMSDANILAICGEETSVGKWVVKNGLGLTVKSNINEIVSVFFDIENGKYENYFDSTRRSILKEKLNFDFYVKALKRKILS